MTAPDLLPSSVPLVFGTAPSTRFGWYHASRGPSRATGVVVCNAIGDDYVRAHRALRHLAETLSKAGFAVLRFDFLGTGDSSGWEGDPARVAAWREDIGLAIAELRTRSGVNDIALVGLKLGGTIAMVAAAEAPVHSLVLWGAYPTGSAYVTETTRLHQMHRMLEPQSFAVEPKDWNGGGEQALGFLLTPETIADLGKLDLLKVGTSPARHTLVIGTGNTAAEGPLVAHLRNLGGEADTRHLPGHKFLVQINHRSDVPQAVIDAIAAWLAERHPVSAGAPAPPPPAPAPAPRADVTSSGERPIIFGNRHPLFGILVEPPPALRSRKRPAIIMTNAGAVHRIGPHRFYVPMARRWASLGFTVFRVDLSGIGDSPAVPGAQENLTYPPDAIDDLKQAMSAVERLTGAQRFIVLGLCSGGDLAFQLGFQDRRIAGSVMMNPRTFCVHDLQMVDSYKRARYYQDSLFRLASWKKAMRGEVDFERAVRLVLPKIKNLVKRRVERFLPGGSREAVDATHNDVPACLRSMAERGVDTFLVASEKDPGVDFVDVHFAREMQALNAVRGYRREDFIGTDHTFTSIYAQQQVSEVLTRHLTEHHL